MRRLAYLLMSTLFCFTVVIPLSQPAMAQEGLQVFVTQVDHSAYPLVTVYVRVEDKRGNLVGSLSQDQFAITEDDQPVTITDFSPVVVGGISTVLTMDRSGSMEERGKMRGAQDAAIAYVQHIRSQDQVALVAFDERVDVVQSFTSDQDVLMNHVEALHPGECTAIYDGLYRSAELVENETGRRVVILITDGIDCREVPEFAEKGSRHTLEESIDRAYRTSVPVHVVGLGDRMSSDVRAGIDENVLKRIASATGGNYYYAPTASELESLYESLAVETQQEYVITYQSPRPTYDGTRRDIRVEVSGERGGSVGSGSGAYLEEHLLNIQSAPMVGAICLLPLLVMLIAPARLRLFKERRQPPPQPAPASHPSPTPPVRQSEMKQPPPPPLPVPLTCHHCGQQLRPGARFCPGCGLQTEAVPPPPPEAPICPSCGHKMRPGAKFCAGCGYRKGGN